MIGISKLYCGTVEPADVLRYARESRPLPAHLLQFAAVKRPVVVWNVTRRCNLRCRHCYAQAADGATGTELSTDQGRALLDDLAQFGCPVVLFSGGEPLLRPDLLELVRHARRNGLRAVLSTNGTLLTPATAAALAAAGLAYAGISLDGLEATNDAFRGVPGAFGRALAGIAAGRDAGLKVGVRFTITRHNAADVDGIFDLVERERIPRVCFYHLVYAGRGAALIADDLARPATRQVVDHLIDRTAALHARGQPTEVLTVDNHCDGPYLFLRLQREGNPRAAHVLELLRLNGGNSSGVGIACVSWDGQVHADQFWRHHSFGNVTQRPFGDLWQDQSDPLMAKLKEKARHVTGRCAQCRFLDACGGNFRVRAEAVHHDPWAPDPACYLTDNEIGVE